MSHFTAYLDEITIRKQQNLSPKPIEDGELIEEIVSQIKDYANEYRDDSLKFLIYNTLPGTTAAAGVKAKFLKEIILGSVIVEEIEPKFAFELLSHMKGGPSVEVLLDLALSDNPLIAKASSEVLKTQVFLYEADTDRLKKAHAAGNDIALEILQSYSIAEFYTNLPDIEEEIKVVTFIAAEGDISTDLLSPGNQAHSRSDRELHGKCMISEKAQSEIQELQKKNPGKRVMLIAEKGTMGVGSSRMSGVNNVALWTGQPASPFIPFVNISFLIDVIVKFVENETKSGVYNVVSENLSLIDIAHRIAHEEGVTEPVIVLVPKGKTSKFRVIAEKLNQFLQSVN